MRLEDLQDGAAYSLNLAGKAIVVFASKKIFTDRRGVFTTDTRVAWEFRDSRALENARIGMLSSQGVWLTVEPNGRLHPGRLYRQTSLIPRPFSVVDIGRTVADLQPATVAALT